MTWRTPCVANPEMWTSDLADSRAYALDQCLTNCHRLLECRAQDEADRKKHLPIVGVSGGIDYTPGAQAKARTGMCQNPRCEKALESPIARQRYCDAKCRAHAKYLRSGRAAA